MVRTYKPAEIPRLEPPIFRASFRAIFRVIPRLFRVYSVFRALGLIPRQTEVIRGMTHLAGIRRGICSWGLVRLNYPDVIDIKILLSEALIVSVELVRGKRCFAIVSKLWTCGS